MSRNIRRTLAKRTAGKSAAAGVSSTVTTQPRSNPQVEALFTQGVQLHQAGRTTDAIIVYQRLLQLQPNYIKALNNLGIALRQLGRMTEALVVYQRVMILEPEFSDTYYNMGVALQKLGRMEEARVAYIRCINLKPDHVQAISNLGVCTGATGRLEKAVEHYYHAIDVKPSHWEAYINLGGALDRLGRLSEAEAALSRALRLNPTSPELLSNYGNVLKSRGLIAEAVAAYRKGLEYDPNYREIYCNLLFALNYMADASPEAIFQAHLDWARTFEQPILETIPRPVFANSRDPGRRLRVGYISPDFKTHSVSHFFEPLLTAHDRAVVETVCYADVTEPDDVTARLQAEAGVWRSIVAVPDAAVAELIRRDGIDILVELAGHTGNNRLPLFAHRPAPVQVTWLGYPNTTGLRSIDYRITDAVADPMGIADPLHTEMLARLPTGFLCYTPPIGTSDPAPPPCLRNGYITFGSFNNLAKVTPDVVRVWAAILQQVPNSRLLIKSIPLADAATCQRYRDLFAQHGVAAERLDLLSRVVSQTGHLDTYGRLDIALDTFPYNGTTTTCEALWMGVPVVTSLGDRHAARVSASILNRIGLPGLIAADEASYIQLARTLATNASQLATLRPTIRARMRASPLCDAPRFARTMEAAYRMFWQRWCA